jgi:hypothetical protein
MLSIFITILNLYYTATKHKAFHGQFSKELFRRQRISVPKVNGVLNKTEVEEIIHKYNESANPQLTIHYHLRKIFHNLSLIALKFVEFIQRRFILYTNPTRCKMALLDFVNSLDWKIIKLRFLSWILLPSSGKTGRKGLITYLLGLLAEASSDLVQLSKRRNFII